jgi:hypothetical protein
MRAIYLVPNLKSYYLCSLTNEGFSSVPSHNAKRHASLAFGNIGVQTCLAGIAILVSNDHIYLTLNRFVLSIQYVEAFIFSVISKIFFPTGVL